MTKDKALAIPGHQNHSFIRLRDRSRPWCSAPQWQASVAICLWFTGTTNTRMVLILLGGVVFMNRMWSLFSKSFSLNPYARQSASDTFPRKKSFNRVLSFFGNWSHSRMCGINWSICWACYQSSVQRLWNFLSWWASWVTRRMTSWSTVSSSLIIQISSVSAPGAPPFTWLSKSVQFLGRA